MDTWARLTRWNVSVAVEVSFVSTANAVRAYVTANYIAPARAAGVTDVKISARAVHDGMGLCDRFPLVCDALRGRKFAEENDVHLRSFDGPDQGSTTVFHFYVPDNKMDPHGQPYNLRFNRARRAERDLSELLGLAKGVLADGVVNESEADFVRQWVQAHPDAVGQWPVSVLQERLCRIYDDGRIDETERRDLAELLSSLVGGRAGIIVGEDAATDLPVDPPPPQFIWSGSVFVFTGQFAFGPRRECERYVARLGGVCEQTVTRRTNYLVIGTFGSRDWVHTPFGRKIEKAVEYRTAGQSLAIVNEDHWAAALARDLN